MDIQLNHVFFAYPTLAATRTPVLHDINLSLTPGECVALLGASGSGKSTLVQILCGLLKPDRGSFLIEGRDFWESKKVRLKQRRRLGLVFQFPESQLFEETVRKEIAFGPANLDLPVDEIERRVRHALTQVNMSAKAFQNRSPFELSSGEQRRIAIAAALAMRPDFLALDEPTAGLDPEGAGRMHRLLSQLHGEGKTLLLVSHDSDFVAALADRVIVLAHGRIIYDGDKAALFEDEQLLRDARVTCPRLVSVAKSLRRLGWRVDNHYTLTSLKAALKQSIQARLHETA